MRDVEVSRLRSWKKWLKLGVWAAQPRSSTHIIKLLIVILLAKNDNYLTPQNARPLDNNKKLCYNIYNEKYAFAASRLLSLSIGENFLL